ncbi:carbohydrate kinase [Mucilaginibacter limnophilus]|uniref:Carbohydrate kinase n=1 Tax=Mucilaginibacter limnophilus TaxID=1932778 RepID=A0A3S2V886_9SPHI|nr:carbohydrate kinase [Mucilaginibacter limnophilus]RVU01000.1 carbohydrate kinase [Mucilaginibacter limnophilus]
MDNAAHIPAICFGEVLWDVLPQGPQPGGAALNVAYHLRKMGIESGLASRIGKDIQGENLEKLLDLWGIKKHLLQFDEHYPTSEVIATLNEYNEASYEIVFPVAWDFISDSKSITAAIKSTTYVIYGSLACRNQVTRDTLLDILEKESIKVLDINLRPPYIDRALLIELLNRANIAKLNHTELESVQSLFQGRYSHETSQVKFVQERFNIPEIVITKGEFGASYYKNNEAYHVAGYEVDVKDTVGSGDAFLAAFIANHYLNESPVTILKNAMSMGGFVATKPGGCPEYKFSEYVTFREQLFSGV